MKTPCCLFSSVLPMALAGCAGPLGPPLGLGPDMYSLAGILILCGLGVLVWRLVGKHAANTRAGNTQGASTAAELLRERYVRGEISREQFIVMRDDIESSIRADRRG